MGRSNFAGVDWASEKHDVLIADEAGEELLAATFAHDEAGLRALCRTLVRYKVALVAIERPDGLLVERLLDAGLRREASGGDPLVSGRERARPAARRYASPRLTATLGLPPVRVDARSRAPARRARLPVVLFSPGFRAPRVLYQALAEDLASHGYLVIAVDHTGEAPVEFFNGDIQLPSTEVSLAAASATRLADIRLILHRLILQRLSATSTGPWPDPGRIAVVGHSLGGSTAAAVMRAEPGVDVGVDIDGSILGSASRRGVTRPFIIMTARTGLDPTMRGLLTHSSGPRLALRFVNLDHAAFSDLPAIAPTALSLGGSQSVRAIAVERAYLRAFLDRYLLNRRSRLLTGPSVRWPQVTFPYRQHCCA